VLGLWCRLCASVRISRRLGKELPGAADTWQMATVLTLRRAPCAGHPHQRFRQDYAGRVTVRRFWRTRGGVRDHEQLTLPGGMGGLTTFLCTRWHGAAQIAVIGQFGSSRTVSS